MALPTTGTEGEATTGTSTGDSTGSTGPATSSGEPLYGVVEPPASP